MKEKREKHLMRKKRIRAKIIGTEKIPRFSVFRSNRKVFLQLINDEKGETLVSAADSKENKKNKTDSAKETGKKLAELAKTKKIKKVVFDRGGYKYHGRVKAAAEGAREGGLEF
jgi:large subunit ribosomal protein L18